jgi:hypothetical protein
VSAVPGARFGRRTAVFGVAAIGAALLAAGAAPWLTVPVPTAIADDVAVVVGSAAVPAARAAGLVLLAAGLALALAGRVARVAAAVAIVVVGLLVVVGVAGFLADPTPVAIATVAEVTGVRVTDVAAQVTAWPAVALGLGAVAAGSGAGVLVTARRWSAGVSRYDRPEHRRSEGAGQSAREGGSAATPDAMADWDALSRGEDPS